MRSSRVTTSVAERGVKGVRFHPTVQGFLPCDRMARPRCEVIAEPKLPAIFHSGHSGIGSGMRCGGGLRLQNSDSMRLEHVVFDFADIRIVIAHPSWPWPDEALSPAPHRPNVRTEEATQRCPPRRSMAAKETAR